jgi:hypothetical protein
MNTADFHIGAGSVSLDGTDVGATTQEGVVVTYEPDVHLHMSGQFGSTPVKASIIGKKLEVQMTLAETTKTNMEDVFAGAVSADNKIKFGGNAGIALTGKTLVITPFDGTETWTFRNAVPTSSIEVAYKADSERVYQVTFTALVDEDAPLAENLAYVS